MQFRQSISGPGGPAARTAGGTWPGRSPAPCETVGFLIVTGHGIPQEVVDRAFAVSREFFDLPVEEKARFMPEDGVAPRGYHAVATRNLARTYGQETPPDLREQFFIGPLVPQAGRFAHIPEAALYYSENIWPARPVAYREALTEFYRAFEGLAERLMGIFAVALGLPETFFDDKIDGHFSTCPSTTIPSSRTPRSRASSAAGRIPISAA